MTPVQPDSDDTVRVLPLPRHRHRGLLAVVAVAALLAVSAGGWLVWPVPSAPPSASAPTAPAPVQSDAPVAASRPVFPIEIATEQQIRDHAPADLSIFRFADNPRILVLDFASLHDQGRMLNRVAALVEKAGLPRDRVLTASQLGEAIRSQGDTIETFYYGHDYGAESLVRFFALADRDQIELYPEEEQLRALLHQEGWFAPGVNAALISLTAAGADSKVTQGARIAILRHELSHGEFFSNPVYAEYVHNFWLTALTGTERAAFRSFLAKDEYDTGNEELMFNEMQAYLMFTRDPLFFTAELAGLTPARLGELQSRFLADMPPGWLRDILAGYQEPASARERPDR
jgi:hypothetical protein